ncbi:energy-coupling factor transporter transmembrane component T family protein [Scopulibacillus cellulosilyticus]|uniref:Energy-coupling factor transporter transmembrane component T family protein n=1 Tax=Scopulibacillus cellulosilyticus TaxID=2665665 RepID=A0ABW2PY77_9BACL
MLTYQTWLSKVNPSLKFLIIAILFIAVLMVHNLNTMIWMTSLFFILYLVFNGFNMKLSFWMLLLSFLLAILSSTTMIFFGQGSHILFQWHLIVISEESLARGLHIGLRTFLYAMLSLVFASTTKPVLFFYSLMQQLKLPPKFAYGFLAAFRILPIMYEEFHIIRAAMKVRGIEKNKGLKGQYNKVKRYAITLLAQSIRRAQRMAVAMEAKRFSLAANRTYYYKVPVSSYDFIFFLTMLVIMAAAFILSSSLPLTPFTNVIE